MHSFKEKSLFGFVALIAFVDGILVTDHFYNSQPPLSTASESVLLENILEQKTSLQNGEESPSYEIPFTTQAPLGVWDKPWSDFAEEACVWMAMQWVKEGSFISIYQTASELKAIASWEEEAFGTSALTDTSQTLGIVNEFFKHKKAFLSGDLTETSLKSYLDNDSVILVPVNGRILDNPYYSDPAPLNHMILITGYNEEGFIAHDPGTRRGGAVLYSVQKILDSAQDLTGERIVIVIQR